MRAIVAVLLFVIGIALIITWFVAKTFPEWLSLPGGILTLFASILVGVAAFGDGLNGTRELLFGKKKDDTSQSIPKNVTQKMNTGSGLQEQTVDGYAENITQEMGSGSGIQKQYVGNSKNVRQKMS